MHTSHRWLRPARLSQVTTMIIVLLTLLPLLAWNARPAAASEGTTALVRVVHAIPDAPNVDVYVDGQLQLANVPFFTVSGYLKLTQGTYRVQVVPAGAKPGPKTIVFEEQLAVANGNNYTVVARGTLATNDEADAKASVVRDNNIPPVFGQARVRVAHFAPNAPAVDIFVNGQRVVQGITFRSTSPYLSVPAGTVTIGVAPANGTVIYTTTATLGAGQVITTWANGLLGASGPQAFKVTPSIDQGYQATARLRAVHAVPDLAGTPVDVYLNGVKAVTFDFFTVTDYLQVYTGRYELEVVPAGGNPKDAPLKASFHIQPNRDYSAVAQGTLAANDNAPLRASLVEDDNAAPAAGQARVRVAHFAPNAPAVDIFVNGQRVVQGITFRSTSTYLSVPAGTVTIGVAPANGTVIYTTTATLGAGQVITTWANGLLGASGPQAFKVTPSIDLAGDAPQAAQVRVLHASPDAPNVDIFVDGQRAVANLPFGEITAYLSLPAGNYRLEVKVAGSDTVVFSGPLVVASGKIYTAAALGVVGSLPGVASFQVKVYEDAPKLSGR